jgi:hypothetical protein
MLGGRGERRWSLHPSLGQKILAPACSGCELKSRLPADWARTERPALYCVAQYADDLCLILVGSASRDPFQKASVQTGASNVGTKRLPTVRLALQNHKVLEGWSWRGDTNLPILRLPALAGVAGVLVALAMTLADSLVPSRAREH